MQDEIAISRSRQSILIEIAACIAFALFCSWVVNDPSSSGRLHAKSVVGVWIALAGVVFGLWNLASPPTLTVSPAGVRFQQWFINAFAPWDRVGASLMGPIRHVRIMLGKKKFSLGFGWPVNAEGLMEFIRSRGQSLAGGEPMAPVVGGPAGPDPFAPDPGALSINYAAPRPQPAPPQRAFGAAPVQNSIVSDAPRFGRRGA